MIYIDPPYNTGNDFVYKDNFTMTKDEYEKLKGNVDEYGERLVKNSSDSGRYHSNWLNMMYPRLQVAKDLLTEDGVIFISIDDNEVHSLRKICDEVFGEDNFVADLIWSNKEGGGSSDSKLFRIKHEHILCYTKHILSLEILGNPISNIERYKLSDEYKKTRGNYYLQKLGMGSIQYSKSLDYPILTPDKTVVLPSDNNKGKKACWRWSRSKYEWGLKNGFIEIKKDSMGVWTVYTKQYLNCDNEGNIIQRTQRPMGIIDEFSSTQASKHLVSLGLGESFNYSKPFELISYLIKRINTQNAIILDFFSGSSTTAHSIMQLNAEDNVKQAGTGNRKFIMVQLPESTDEKSEAFKADYKNICEIGKERIRRAGDKIIEENKDTEGIEKLDIGFKVFKVADTNFKRIEDKSDNMDVIEIEGYKGKDAADFNPHFTDIDTVYELMLRRQDIKLTEEIKKLNNIGDRTYLVGDTMLVCLEEKITSAMVEEIGNINTDLSWIVLRDSAFDDDCELKINTTRMLRTIIKESKNKEQKIYWI